MLFDPEPFDLAAFGGRALANARERPSQSVSRRRSARSELGTVTCLGHSAAQHGLERLRPVSTHDLKAVGLSQAQKQRSPKTPKNMFPPTNALGCPNTSRTSTPSSFGRYSSNHRTALSEGDGIFIELCGRIVLAASARNPERIGPIYVLETLMRLGNSVNVKGQ